jgi:hypothetical protein
MPEHFWILVSPEVVMPRKNSSLLKNLSTSDLKNLLAARERIDVLEVEKARLTRELAKVDKELDRLLAGADPGRSPVRPTTTGKKAAKKVAGKKDVKKAAKKKAAKKKATKKKATKKKATKKAATKKKVAKKAVRKSTAVAKRAVRTKTAGRGKPRAKTGANRVKLEDVVASVIRKSGAPVSFQDIMAAIVEGKLFATRSTNFDNVLRRTLSTSKMIKRVGRGIYDVA